MSLQEAKKTVRRRVGHPPENLSRWKVFLNNKASGASRERIASRAENAAVEALAGPNCGNGCA